MKNKYIILREGYDWLCVGNSENEITITQYNTLCMYLKNNVSQNAILYGYNKLKVINYVGIISVGNLVVEILPKISLSNEASKDREILMFMLSKCNKLSVNIKEMLNTNIIRQPLLDILAKIFTQKLLKELQKGKYFEYISQEDSLYKIKGKVMLTQNAKINATNKAKVYCKYDEFTENNLFNSILKSAANTISTLVKDREVKKEVNIIRNLLLEVEDIYISKDTLNEYRLNRKNERFIEAFTLAKLILSNTTMDKSTGSEKGFSILFEMNYLYEEYIGILLKEALEDENTSVRTQEKSKYLLWNTKTQRNEIALKPDVVIYENNKPQVIIDTKWKAASIDNREIYTQGDIYQMYAYITTYTSCKRCILLYPRNSHNILHSTWKLNPVFGNKEILIYEISLESYNKTKEELLVLMDSAFKLV